MFGDAINTDLMVPGPYLMAPEEEQKKAVFSANRPGWVDQVEQGDIIIGGRSLAWVPVDRPLVRCAISVWQRS
jgi:3-isopropylmalate/(R)-2-methylmalate dehydratase small subunit